MNTRKIDLYGEMNVPRGAAIGGYLHAYVPTESTELNKKTHPAMIVCAGGAYRFLSDRESEPVALRFVVAGYCAFVLEYTVNAAFPTPLIEACMAVAYLREHAGEYGISEDHIGVIGFSAGGNLAAMTATLFAEPEITNIMGKHAKHARPNAAVLCYPVATLDICTHGESCAVITGGDEKLRERISPDKRVTNNSAPAFIWHTAEDDCVPVENALRIAEAYRKARVPFALHVFEKGWHGLSLCNAAVNDQTPAEVALNHVGKWFDLALDWLDVHGFRVEVKGANA
ncbi:MAG: alpha/beta hydrolase [Clostridiales bacterium]|nr:alpha/beta hydrolase [Clostridiales bacterium]